MIDFIPLSRLGWDLLWQSTLLLSLGLLLARICRRWPARAHLLLVLAGMAAVSAPAVTLLVRGQNWGLLPSAMPLPLEQPSPLPASVVAFLTEPQPGPVLSRIDLEMQPGALGEGQAGLLLDAEPHSSEAIVPGDGYDRSSPAASAVWPGLANVLLWAWGVATSWLLLLRLAVSCATAQRWIRDSRPADESRLRRLIDEVSRQLGCPADLEVRRSPRCASPMIWCWRRRPVLLLPTCDVELDGDEELAGVIAHELAHWRRRDHLTSLAIHCACCLLPWQPLLWKLRTRLAALAEDACDDWALEAGCSAPAYAEALLRLIPQPTPAMALAVVSGGAGLAGRIRRILAVEPRELHTSGHFRLAAAAAAIIVVASLASLQAREENRAAADSAAGAASRLTNEAEQTNEQQAAARGLMRHVSGILEDTDGKPIAGATLWLAARRNTNTWVFSRFDEDKHVPLILAETRSDAEGRFAFDYRLPAGEYNVFSVARAEGYGLVGRWVKNQPRSDNARMVCGPPMELSGRVLDPNGMPVANASVTVTTMQRRARDGWFLSLSSAYSLSDSIPSYWPQPVRTDAEGQFSIAGLSEDLTVSLRIDAADYPAQSVLVRDTIAETKYRQETPHDAFPALPAKHVSVVLEPKRLLTGRMIDAVSKQPLSGAQFVLQAMTPGQHAGSTIELTGESDAEGTYRVMVPSAANYFVLVKPMPGHLPVSGNIDGREMDAFFAAKETHVRDLSLTPGRVQSGQVVDADTKAPLPGVCLMYLPSKNNPNGRSGDNYYQPVVADEQGRFEITVLPGSGRLIVMNAPPDYIRQPWPASFGTMPSGPPLAANFEVDIPGEGEIAPLEIACRRGQSITLQAIAPDGELAQGVRAYSNGVIGDPSGTARDFGVDFGDRPILVQGCAEGETYRVFIYSGSSDAGAVVEVSIGDDRDGPLTVQLQPCGAIKGRLTYPGGVPAAGISLFNVFVRDDGEMISAYTDGFNLPFYGNFTGRGSEMTNADGQFEIRHVIPQVRVILRMNERLSNGRTTRPLPLVQPGQTVDVGTIELRR